MTTATATETRPFPDLHEDKSLAAWRSQLAESEPRYGELLARMPGLKGMADANGRGEHRDAYNAALAELRGLETSIADLRRAIGSATQQDRSRWAYELSARKEFRNAQKRAFLAYADSLAAIGELWAMYWRASRLGVHLSPALPMAVTQDIDGVTRWAKELIRLEIIKPGELPGWLQAVTS